MAMRALVAVVGLAVLLVIGSSPAAAPAGSKTVKTATDLDALLGQFRKAPGLFARFKEEKRLAMLDAPLVTEGTIHFMPPARLARRAEKPIASTLLIDGNGLQFGDADGHQSMDLGTNPVARLFVDSFVMLLAGDRAGLERIFKVQFQPRPNGGWQLLLLPRVSPMDKVIKDLSLQGEGLTLRTLDVRESNGDTTHTVFTDVDVNHRYSAAEQAQVFRLPQR
jgi:hypothetical protein